MSASRAVALVAFGIALYLNGMLMSMVKMCVTTLAGVFLMLIVKQDQLLYVPCPDGVGRSNPSNPYEFANMPFEDVRILVENGK